MLRALLLALLLTVPSAAHAQALPQARAANSIYLELQEVLPPARRPPQRRVRDDRCGGRAGAGASVSIVTVLVDRELFDKLGGFNELPRIREDYEFLHGLRQERTCVRSPNRSRFIGQSQYALQRQRANSRLH
jgi:hypothetical protein